MNETALITLDSGRLQSSFTSTAEALKETALTSAALIGKVENAGQQADAVAAQTELARIIRDVEKARKEAKQPIIDFGRQIDDKAKAFVKEIEAENWRIGALVNSFQELERKRVFAAQQAENARLAEIERQKAAEIAKARTHEQMEAVQEKFAERVKAEAPPIEAIASAKAKGQVVTETWEFEVTDIHALYRHHPNLVKLEPIRGEIKSLLKNGVDIKGVRGWKETNSNVRLGRTLAAIELS